MFRSFLCYLLYLQNLFFVTSFLIGFTMSFLTGFPAESARFRTQKKRLPPLFYLPSAARYAASFPSLSTNAATAAASFSPYVPGVMAMLLARFFISRTFLFL